MDDAFSPRSPVDASERLARRTSMMMPQEPAARTQDQGKAKSVEWLWRNHPMSLWLNAGSLKGMTETFRANCDEACLPNKLPGSKLPECLEDVMGCCPLTEDLSYLRHAMEIQGNADFTMPQFCELADAACVAGIVEGILPRYAGGVREWMNTHHIVQSFGALFTQLAREQPGDPYLFAMEFFQKRHQRTSEDMQANVFLKALQTQDVEKCRQLVQKEEVNLAVVDPKTGRNPLHFAATMASHDSGVELLLMLLDRRCPGINAKDNNGWCPLHWAAFAGVDEGVDLLLDFGADHKAVTSKGRTALELALDFGHDGVEALLRSHDQFYMQLQIPMDEELFSPAPDEGGPKGMKPDEGAKDAKRFNSQNLDDLKKKLQSKLPREVGVAEMPRNVIPMALKMAHLLEPGMEWLWIGNRKDASSAEALKANGVKYVLNCTIPPEQGGVRNYHDEDPYFTYCRLPLKDNAQQSLESSMEPAWAFLDQVREKNDGGVLIHCIMGQSRSVSVLISYLMKHYRKTYDLSLALVKEVRAIAEPNAGFEQQLRDFQMTLVRG
mmetsp:Transcript_36091/g.94493  ORF Transcript_36091/g.94493 Transcript_36091/m.94493 type:complete len:552 (-) Transcript_36091:37-1692(-)